MSLIRRARWRLLVQESANIEVTLGWCVVTSRTQDTLETSAIKGLAHDGPHPETERASYDALGRIADRGPLGDEGLV
jgi:hypothetical protein